MDYTEFCNQYEGFARTLYRIGKEVQGELKMPEEDPLYNAGTMSRSTDIPISSNIVLANAKSFKNLLVASEAKFPDMSDEERKARIICSYLSANGVDMSYDKKGQDILFGDVTRSYFYQEQIFKDIVGNTNYNAKFIGDLQIISLEDKGDAMPRKTEDCRNFVAHIPADEQQEIFLKRGLYHESVHAALGTDDERKCDVFALLKVMKEHPKYAKEVFEVFNYQRSQIGSVISNMSKGDNISALVKRGEMTYIMPKTYEALRQYAEHPERIPETDRDILKLTYEMTSKPEFSAEELKSFVGLLHPKKVDDKALNETAVMQACHKQGAFMTKYVAMSKMKTMQRQQGGR